MINIVCKIITLEVFVHRLHENYKFFANSFTLPINGDKEIHSPLCDIDMFYIICCSERVTTQCSK